MKTNPLLNWNEIPPFNEIKIQHIEPAIVCLLEELEAELHSLESRKADRWETIMPDLERINDRLGRCWGIVTHLMSVKNCDELREIHQSLQPKYIAFLNRLNQSREIFDSLTELRNGEEWSMYDCAQQRIIDSSLETMKLSGVGLAGKSKERFNEISNRLATLTTLFSNHVLDSTKAYYLTLTSPDEIEGLPQNYLSLAAQSALAKGYQKATPEKGPWVVTLDLPSYLPFLKHSKCRKLREQLYRKFVTRASEDDLNNLPVINEILVLRQEMAELLGMTSYASVSLRRKMAQTIHAVDGMHEKLLTAAFAAGQKDFQEILGMAERMKAPEANDFQPWDIVFWSERLREEKYLLNEEELRPYFPLPKVLSGMFKLVQHLFDIQVIAADGEASVWHDDVRYFRVQDLDGQELASFFLDPYSRPHEKQGGAWANTPVQRSTLFAAEGKSVRLPVAYMCCNQTPPIGDKPSLMTFREVETLFHEFGHALQHMLTTVNYGMASGLANIEWDAVEIASQFMENWCYQRSILKMLTGHYASGEPLPEEWMDRIIAARTFQAGHNMLRQLQFGRFDMELHARYSPNISILEVQKKIAKETVILQPIPEDRFPCSFSHIFSGGYAAGYYSYKWSEVLSADAFSAFLEAGLDDEDKVKEIGRRFRDTILAKGGSEHPSKIFRKFRGREPSVDALLKQEQLI